MSSNFELGAQRRRGRLPLGPPATRPVWLSQAERSILSMLVKENMAVEDIARRLGSSRRFVRSHVVALLRKHGVVRHEDLIALARRLYVELAA